MRAAGRPGTPSGGVSPRPRPLAPAVFSGARFVPETEPLLLSPSPPALGRVSPPQPCPGGAEARPPGQPGVSGTGAGGAAREARALPRKGAIA